MRISDWSSDVCSSDLSRGFGAREASLFDLAQDAGTPRQFRAGDRHHRLSHPYPDRCRLLCCAGADPPQMENRSEEHTSELQSLMRTSYAVFCWKKKKQK